MVLIHTHQIHINAQTSIHVCAYACVHVYRCIGHDLWYTQFINYNVLVQPCMDMFDIAIVYECAHGGLLPSQSLAPMRPGR